MATSLYEDFLYYQTSECRNQYREHIDEKKGEKKRSMRKGQPPGILTEDYTYDKLLRPIVDSFERDGVGTTEEINYKNMGPDMLHVRLPRARRFAVGLGRPRNPRLLSPINLHLDLEAIEKRRRGIEDRNEDQSAMDESHSERRVRQLELVPRLPTVKDLKRTRLESGLFIAAGETSFDWKTSYDRKEQNDDDHMNKMSDEDFESGDEDSSENENDLFAISYRECSSLEDCPCGGKDQGNSSHSGDGGHGGHGGHVNEKEGDSGVVAPVSVAGGSLIVSKKTTANTKTTSNTKTGLGKMTRADKEHRAAADDSAPRENAYKKLYNRHQIR
jgi:hypothetical protein